MSLQLPPQNDEKQPTLFVDPEFAGTAYGEPVPVTSFANLKEFVVDSDHWKYLREHGIKTQNCYTYMIKVNMAGSNYAGYSFLIHEKKFTDAEFREMVQIAAKVTEDSSIQSRRQRMAKEEVPISRDPREIVRMNENLFIQDLRFLEAAMCDKFDFRMNPLTHATVDVQPTIKT